MKELTNNKVLVEGELITNFSFSHEISGEGFYEADMAIERKSGVRDIVPLMISEYLIDIGADCEGTRIWVEGQIRTRNYQYNGKNKLQISVFALSMGLAGENDSINEVCLEGYVTVV